MYSFEYISILSVFNKKINFISNFINDIFVSHLLLYHFLVSILQIEKLFIHF